MNTTNILWGVFVGNESVDANWMYTDRESAENAKKHILENMIPKDSKVEIKIVPFIAVSDEPPNVLLDKLKGLADFIYDTIEEK